MLVVRPPILIERLMTAVFMPPIPVPFAACHGRGYCLFTRAEIGYWPKGQANVSQPLLAAPIVLR